MIREVGGALRGTGGSPVSMVENPSCGAVRRCGNGVYLHEEKGTEATAQRRAERAQQSERDTFLFALRAWTGPFAIRLFHVLVRPVTGACKLVLADPTRPESAQATGVEGECGAEPSPTQAR
jgi:hypothetical protein